MLEVTDLECERDDRVLFEKLSFTLNPGEILQVIGTNGSGKTSLIRIICGLLPATQGCIHWHGKSIEQCRDNFFESIHYLGHKTGVKQNLSPKENLQVDLALANATKTNEIEQALSQLGLQHYQDVLAKSLSAGQQRRIGLARLLLSDKPLWILDEPLTALDAAGIDVVKSLIQEHIGKQGMVILSSHQSIASPQMPIKELRLD